MAGERWGRASFPGVLQVDSCEYTCSHGIIPGSAILTIAPQAGFEAAGGTLVIYDGFGTVTLRDCKVENHKLQRSGAYIWQLSILDRRWKWKFGHISGNYNLRDGNGAIIKRTERTPQQLAILCLEAAGETGYDVSSLTDDPKARPYINWDYDVPMAMLEDLAEAYGCRVVWDPVSNTTSLRPTGIGAALPDGPIVDDSLTIDPPEMPDLIRIACGPTRYNTWIVLEPVGLDKDGRILPINELSYAPVINTGPGIVSWGDMETPEAEVRDPEDKTAVKLAQDTIWRWYRITVRSPSNPSNDDARLIIPFIGPIQHRAQLLPLEETQADTGVDDPAPPNPPPDMIVQHTPMRPIIKGTFLSGQLAYANEENAIYQGGYEIDKENGVIKFEQRMYHWLGANPGGPKKIAPPELLILLGVTVRHPETNGMIKYERDLVLGTAGTKPKVIRHDEVRLSVVPEFNEDYSLVAAGVDYQVTSNAEELNQLLDFYLAGAAKEYESPLPQTRTYGGIHPFRMDGAIQQITWRIGGGDFAITTVSRNDEHKTFLLSHKERRRLTSRGSIGSSAAIAGSVGGFAAAMRETANNTGGMSATSGSSSNSSALKSRG